MTTAPVPISRRARPMPVDERRAALIASTIPLLFERGVQVTTRQIAEAAGIAEGTIFRVFPDKEGLIEASVRAACDPTPMLAELASIDLSLPLRARVTEIVTIMQRRLMYVIKLMIAIRAERPPTESDKRSGRDTNELAYQAVVRLLEPDSDQFRMPVRDVVRLLRLLTFSGSHPMITDGELLTPDQIAGVLLDGVCKPHGTA